MDGANFNVSMDTDASIRAFWELLFSEADSLRIGPHRIAEVNGRWAVMSDGDGYPLLALSTLQVAVDYCLRQFSTVKWLTGTS